MKKKISGTKKEGRRRWNSLIGKKFKIKTKNNQSLSRVSEAETNRKVLNREIVTEEKLGAAKGPAGGRPNAYEF